MLSFYHHSGHHGNVYSASWSHGNPWFISCSSDKTASLWCLSQKDPLLTISHSQTNSKVQQKVGAQSGKTKQGSKVALEMLPTLGPPATGYSPFVLASTAGQPSLLPRSDSCTVLLLGQVSVIGLWQ